MSPLLNRPAVRGAAPTLFALAGLLPAATLAATPFETPWIGYNVGESAYAGNPAPMERDPYALTSADFDGDGAPDIAVANYDYAAPGGTTGQSGFVILFNQGDGSFGEPVHTTVSTRGHFDIVADDVDADGDQDLILPHSGRIGSEVGNTVLVYHNDGSGSFSLAGSHAVQELPLDIALGDFDGDGRRDIVAGSYRFDVEHVAILRNTGTGFAPQQTVLAGQTPDKVTAADWNDDGRDDLAVAALGNLVVIMNDGSGGFLPPVMLSDPSGIDPIVGVVVGGDLDADGNLDLVHGAYQGSGTYAGRELVVRLGNGDGTFAEPAYYSLLDYGTAPEEIILVDLDADGDLDVATCDWSGRGSDGVIVMFNDGTGILGDRRHLPAGQGTHDITIADLDLDGDPDLASADQLSMAVTVHLNPGDGRFPLLETRYPTDTATTLFLDVADVDGDGDLDALASGGSTGVPGALIKGNGDGTFEAPVVYTHSTQYGRGVSNGKLRDLDGDGDLDLLYNDAHTDFFTGYDFWVALNDGTGTFGTPVEWDQNTCGNGDVDAFDLDGDGDLDVVNLEELGCAGEESANKLYVNLNHGDATFAPPIIIEIDTGPRDVEAGDFNEDGIVDLVTSHWMPYGLRNYLNVHIGNGDGTFQEEQLHFVGEGPRFVRVADLDGDGHQDLATGNSGSDDIGRETVTVLFGSGTGTFSGRTDYYAPYSPDLLGVTGLTTSDVDADGDLDLLLTTVANGVAVYVNDGNGGFSFPRRLGVYWSPFSPVHRDFDADGIADLVSLVSLPPSGGPRDLGFQKGIETTTVGVPSDGPSAGLPVSGAVLRAFPNPFRSRVAIDLAVVASQPVSVAVFDPSGRRVMTLHDGPMAAGELHGFRVDAGDLPSGVYFVRAEGASFSTTERVTLLR